MWTARISSRFARIARRTTPLLFCVPMLLTRLNPCVPILATTHVEAVLLLTKLNVERHIEVDVSMDELDVTAAESKATYNEIRDYVWEHHQLKVSNLYIAQVKEKCGIKKRENYNKPKSNYNRQPRCPSEKETAIRDALKFYKII